MEFLLNGRPANAGGCAPHITLLDFLRSRGLTGAKEGCAEGECGACTVVMVRPRGLGSAYVPVNSCLVFLPMVANHEVYTVEALAASGQLADCQREIAERGGSQCGYCTPGFVMSLFAEQYRPGREGGCDPHSMGGNLCRCTGYRPLRDAALAIGTAPDDGFRRRLAQPAPELAAVDCEGFARPGTLRECFRLMEEHPDARLIAGGTDVAVESNLRFRRFPYLISLEALPELRMLRESAEALEIGAGLPLAEIDLPHPVWREWLELFASPQIRNRATLGGNLATASPIGDSAPLLLAFDARVRIAGPRGERVLPLDKFFQGYRRTALEPGELLVSIVIPKPLPPVARFYKAAKRRMDDISTVAACFAVHADGSMRAAYGGVAPTPIRAYEAERALPGSPTRAVEILGRTMKPISDHRGSAAYRLALSQSLLEKFFWEREVA
jgi:xanthine dehydrogenase small subunit